MDGTTPTLADPPAARPLLREAEPPPTASREVVAWLRSHTANAARGVLLIRPFTAADAGGGAAAPSAAQLLAVNTLLARVRYVVAASARRLAAAASGPPTPARLAEVQRLKAENGAIIADAERVWQFFWEILSQRQTFVAPMLLAADRIALDCYQGVWQGLGRARSIPSPPPFAFLESGIGPATYRRGVTMARIGRLPNPFPLVKLPYHRMVTPWTLGAVPHEVGHNLQADLGLWFAVPRALMRRFVREALPREVARIWVRWAKEIWADLISVLLIGPSYVGSLKDVVGRSPQEVALYSPAGVHPVPWLRVLIVLHLLGRIGFAAEAAAHRRAWLALYPAQLARSIPPPLRLTFARAVRATVDEICFRPSPQLGGKALAEVVRFRPQDQAICTEAARRVARGIDPGIVPERFLIAASRIAFDGRFAAPDVIARNVYEALGRR